MIPAFPTDEYRSAPTLAIQTQDDEEAIFAVLEKEDDFDYSNIREKRMEELKAEMSKLQEMKANNHGTYEIMPNEKAVLDITTKTKNVVVHFFHKEFRRCQIMDKHLLTLARKHFKTRFIKVDVENSPFLVEKLNIRILPCLIAFIDGVSVYRVVGFETLGNTDSFATSTLENSLICSGVISPLQSTVSNGPTKKKKTIFGFSERSHENSDSEDEDE